MSKVKHILYMFGKGSISVYKHLYLLLNLVDSGKLRCLLTTPIKNDVLNIILLHLSFVSI